MLTSTPRSGNGLRAPVVAVGTTYWITGLPGAGKSSLGRLLWWRLHANGRPALLLDGDTLRRIIGQRYGYSRPDRHALASMYGQLCHELSRQGADVVCATVSMFEDVRQWNRANIPGYREIYLRVPIEILKRRHPKGLYAAAEAGRVRDVPGMDQAFEAPSQPDVIIENDGSKSIEAVAEELFGTWPDELAADAPAGRDQLER